MLRYLVMLIIFATPLKAEVTLYDSWSIPEFVKPEPNLETLRFYLKRELDAPARFDKWTVKPARTPKQFKSNIQKNSFLSRQMETSSIVSYLYYDNGKIVYVVCTHSSLSVTVIIFVCAAARLRSHQSLPETRQYSYMVTR